MSSSLWFTHLLNIDINSDAFWFEGESMIKWQCIFSEFWHFIWLLAWNCSNPSGREEAVPWLHLPLPLPWRPHPSPHQLVCGPTWPPPPPPPQASHSVSNGDRWGRWQWCWWMSLRLGEGGTLLVVLENKYLIKLVLTPPSRQPSGVVMMGSSRWVTVQTGSGTTVFTGCAAPTLTAAHPFTQGRGLQTGSWLSSQMWACGYGCSAHNYYVSLSSWYSQTIFFW